MAGRSGAGSIRKLHTRGCARRAKCTCGERGTHKRSCPKSAKCRCAGRWQARITTPAGVVTAPSTFDSKEDAEGWVTKERERMTDPETYQPPKVRARAARAAADLAEASSMPTFENYARRWIAERKVKGQPLAARTRDHYERLLDSYLVPTFGQLSLDAVSPELVNVWYDSMTPTRKRHQGRKVDGSTTKAHTYSLARAIMNTATDAHGPLVGRVNPFAVRGGGSSRAKKRTELVTSAELDVILATIRPEWRLMVLLALWTGLRFSELAELRRSDVDLNRKVIVVRRSVSRSKVDGVHVKGTKSDAGERDMNIPENVVLPALRDHLRTYVTGRDGLLFPGLPGEDGTPKHLAPSTFYGGRTRKVKGRRVQLITAGSWYAARKAAGREDLHFHDLRATGATLLAQQGATEAEVMAFLGDSTPQAAQRYVRAARSRMTMLTGKLSALAEGGEW